MQDIKNLKDLRREITKEENKRKQIYMVWLGLEYVKKNHDAFLEIGMGWLDEKYFLFNSTIFGRFADRKINTINHHFESYNFHHQKINSEIKRKACNLYSIGALADQKSWCLRWCDGFIQSTTDNEAKNWNTFNTKKRVPYYTRKINAPENILTNKKSSKWKLIEKQYRQLTKNLSSNQNGQNLFNNQLSENVIDFLNTNCSLNKNNDLNGSIQSVNNSFSANLGNNSFCKKDQELRDENAQSAINSMTNESIDPKENDSNAFTGTDLQDENDMYFTIDFSLQENDSPLFNSDWSYDMLQDDNFSNELCQPEYSYPFY